ncbi:MAG TPA: undecaprenyl-diphosphate phosphatase [Aggregatilineales bacterium]|nr:undecaprenyl-diphosphate phosphatase [Aggregatilineales bacterium]
MAFVEYIKVIILGIVQGITEFLPISSTGHLIVTSEALRFQNSIDGTFEIFIQLGSVLAVMLFYRGELLRQVRTVTTDKGVQRLWLAIVVAAIPAAVVGFLARDFVKSVLYSSAVIGISLIVGGIVFIILERRLKSAPPPEAPQVKLEAITLRQALAVGLIQVLALVPGVSRSGSSIFGGLLSGLNRPTATAFSFFLSIPVLGGATVADLLLSLDQIAPDQIPMLLLGALVSMIVSLIAIGWLLRYVARNTFTAFGVYRILAGALILALVAVGFLN